MLSAYEAYEKRVCVIKMPEGYSARGEIPKRGIVQILKNVLPYILLVVMGIAAFFIWRKRKTHT